MRSGFRVLSVCNTASQVLSICDEWDSGILVSGYRFADMVYAELRECLPSAIDMLLLTSPSHWTEPCPKGVVYLPLPLKVHDLVDTLEMMVQAQARKKRRSRPCSQGRTREEQALIDQAKHLLMERNKMSETEAHRYIQKCSMDSGTNMVETAQMVMSLL